MASHGCHHQAPTQHGEYFHVHPPEERLAVSVFSPRLYRGAFVLFTEMPCEAGTADIIKQDRLNFQKGLKFTV